MKKTIEISKPNMGNEEIEMVVKVLKSGHLSQGALVKKFEKEIARYCGTKYAVAVNSGTAALHCALYGMGVKTDDEVITSPFTFVATTNAILMQKAKPIFCDINENTFNIDPSQIESKITKKTKIILPVSMYGHTYDVAEINAIAENNKLRVLEDAAQSIGAEYKKRKTGSLADVTSFSLYATKNITSGEGGAITTNDKAIANSCRSFRHHGQKENTIYEYISLGYNYRMTDIAAAIAIEQLKKIEKLTMIRRRNAKLLFQGLTNINGLILPVENPDFKDVYYQYTIRITKKFKTSREKFIKYLMSQGITARVYYPKPLHLHPHIEKLGYKKGDFPVAERLANEIVSIPVHPLVSEREINYIIEKIKMI